MLAIETPEYTTMIPVHNIEEARELLAEIYKTAKQAIEGFVIDTYFKLIEPL